MGSLAPMVAFAVLFAATSWSIAGMARRQPLPIRNYRGLPVTTAGGFAVMFGVTVSTGIFLALRGTDPDVGRLWQELGAGIFAASTGALFGIFGFYDDVAGEPDQKGWAAHLEALRRLRPTAGVLKMLGAVALGLWFIPRASVSGTDEQIIRAITVALVINALNGFDLRPLRMSKFVAVACLPLFFFGWTGVGSAVTILIAVAATVPAERSERIILGDTGAFAIGGMLGLAWSRQIPAGSANLMILLAVAALLNVLAVKPGISAMIDKIAPLGAFDRLGRRTDAPPPPGE
jgi:UDP-N-acetylmuramyl pentapeptide phosphotransferase/UDP-N-acetylglucosamine-1-phosphate transferase